MTSLIAGLLVFFAVHLIPSLPNGREKLARRLGEHPYKGLFALISLSGMVLIVFGMGDRAYVPLWEPPMFASHLALLLMLPAFVLLAAAYLPGNIKRFTRHPMLWGVTLWAVGHLLANGDLGSVLLFGGFGVYSLFAMWSANRRGAAKSVIARPLYYDLIVVAVGITGYVLFLFLHPSVIGVAVIS